MHTLLASIGQMWSRLDATRRARCERGFIYADYAGRREYDVRGSLFVCLSLFCLSGVRSITQKPNDPKVSYLFHTCWANQNESRLFSLGPIRLIHEEVHPCLKIV